MPAGSPVSIAEFWLLILTRMLSLQTKIMWSWRALDDVICQADFVSLHLPLLPETRGLVNDEFLGKMKKGSFLINTSRGEAVDEAALLKSTAERSS